MSVPLASSPISLAASGIATPEPSSWNQQVYHRLKLALALGLRRQIFLAVCDDSPRASELAIALQADGDLSQQTCLASTQLDPVQSAIADQIRRALPQSPPQSADVESSGVRESGERRAVCLQLLGIAALTRQSASHQWSFLRQLRDIPAQMTELDASLVFWISRPWLSTIQHSAPEFWRCCTGVFEFCGEPIGGHAPLNPPTTSPTAKPAQADDAEPPATVPRQPTTSLPPRRAVPAAAKSTTIWQYVDKALVRAIAATRSHFPARNPLAALQQIERLHRVRAEGDRLGLCYQKLGNLYRDRLNPRPNASGDFSERDFSQCARIAVHLYRRALSAWQHTPPKESGQMLATLNDIGTLYWMLARQAPATDRRIHDLELSLRAYRRALSSTDAPESPQVRATLQHNLGSVYADLGRIRQTPDDWERAIAAFGQALLLSHSDRAQAASIQNNLGTAHWSLAQFGNADERLRSAIAAYEAALGYYNSDRDEMTYAMLQSNLGTAYWTLSQSGRDRHALERAIAAYSEALKYRTADRFPAGCAATQNNLGTAYWYLAQQSDDAEAVAYWQQAIVAYEAAIAAAGSQMPLTFDLYATHNNLGLTHYSLGVSPSGDRSARLQHLNAALDAHLRAFQGWQSQPSRQDTARAAIVRSLRAIYDFGSMDAQTAAFSRVPGNLLSELMGEL